MRQSQTDLAELYLSGRGREEEALAFTGFLVSIPIFYNSGFVVLPLLISTAMRFVQGSGTVAMVTADSITAPILNNAGVNPLLSVIACCVGSLFFGYFNDSYFWVVNLKFGHISWVSEVLILSCVL